MPRYARAKQRGLRFSIAKYGKKEKAFSTEGKESCGNEKFCGIPTSQVSRAAETCFKLLCRSSCVLAIVPMDYREGRLVPSSRKRRIIHNAGVAIFTFITALRLAVTIPILQNKGLTVETILTLLMLFPYLTAACYGAPLIFRCTETLQLMNSWKYILECMERAAGQKLSGYEHLPLSLKVIVTFNIALFPSLVLPILPVLYPALPLGIHNLFPNFGAGNAAQAVAFRVACAPVDLVMILVPGISASFAVCILIIGIDMLKLYFESIRYRNPIC